jgi:hypothetical protein
MLEHHRRAFDDAVAMLVDEDRLVGIWTPTNIEAVVDEHVTDPDGEEPGLDTPALNVLDKLVDEFPLRADAQALERHATDEVGERLAGRGYPAAPAVVVDIHLKDPTAMQTATANL